jgi:hypothetical protein
MAVVLEMDFGLHSGRGRHGHFITSKWIWGGNDHGI